MLIEIAASILPLSTAYTVCEALGFESGLNKRFRQAPAFYWLYTGLIVIGAAAVLLPNVPLIKVAVFSQVLNGMMLPIVLVVILLLVSNSDIMGEYKNSSIYNVLTWTITILIIALTVYMLYTQFLHPA